MVSGYSDSPFVMIIFSCTRHIRLTGVHCIHTLISDSFSLYNPLDSLQWLWGQDMIYLWLVAT